MYHEYYHLKENPFNVTADSDYFFSSTHHRAALSNLMYGIDQQKGIMVIIGEVGTGKTTLCRKLLKQSDGTIQYAFILNPKCSELQLIQMIITDLGIETKAKNKFALLEALNQYLLREANLNHKVAIIIDEAQNLSINQLEQIRLLSNLETEKEKLLQIILVGQPELNYTLRLPQLRQLRQRIAIFYQLEPLSLDDVKLYIQHRLALSGSFSYQKDLLYFTDTAINKIFHYTQGSPRTINMLCDRALLAGFVAEIKAIDQEIIDMCAKEVVYCEHYL